MELKLWLFATLFGISLQVVFQAEIPTCNVGGENSPEKCCPVSADQCPYNYQLVNINTTDACEDDDDNKTTTATTTVPVTTTITTDDTTTIVNNTNDEAKDDDDDEMPGDIIKEISICKKCGEYEHFNNEAKTCKKCDAKCLICDKEALSNCTVCKYEHEDECHSKCPEGLVPGKKTENGSRLCEKENDDEDGLPIAIIAGAAGGGGVLLIIVIVVIVCCCCRRSVARQDKKERLTMSVILEQQQNNESSTTIQETENKPKDQRRRKNYENMEQTMPGTQDIVRQQDVIGRYTRDPTLEPKRKGKGQTEEEDDSGGYANHAMVQLAKTTNLASVDSSRLEKQLEEKELEMLPQAPGAPAIPVPTSTKPQKQGIVKRLSQRLVKQKKGKSKDKSPAAPADQENSLMTQSSSNLVPDNKDTGEENMEDYENITISGTQGRKAMCKIAKALEDNDMEIYENYDVTNNQQIDPVAQAAGSVGNVDDLEDYENTKNFRKPDNGVPEGGNDVVGLEGEPTGDLEDYENMKGLEPYENVSFAQAHGRKAGK